MRVIKLLLIAVLFVSFTYPIGNSINESMDVNTIVAKTYNAFKYLGDDRIATADMSIRNRQGKEIMTRNLVLIRKNTGGELQQKWYAYFRKPADIRKMVFMVWKYADKDDDRWIYLPAMDLVKRLAGSDKRSSFAGSQFVYEDVTGRYPDQDDHQMINDGGTHYEIMSTPRDQGEVEFSYYHTWVDKKTYLPTKRVFYDKNQKKQREYRAEKVEDIQGFPTITEFSMTNIQTGESTYTVYSNIKYNVGIPDNLFTEAYLRRTPRQWLNYDKK